MNDVLYEQIVKKKKTKKDSNIRKLIIALTVFLTTVAMCLSYFFGNYSFIPATVIYFIISWKLLGRLIEYEYAYFNGNLQIDIIRNKASRKPLFNGNVADFELMAHIDDSEHLAPYSELPAADFSSTDKLGNTYIFIAPYKGKRYRIIIEPNEQILKAMSVVLTPRRCFKKQ